MANGAPPSASAASADAASAAAARSTTMRGHHTDRYAHTHVELTGALTEIDGAPRSCLCESPSERPHHNCGGAPCKVNSHLSIDAAIPLRLGGRFCAHHHPNKFMGTQCEGITKRGKGPRCRVFSGSLYRAADPLREQERFCSLHCLQKHAEVQCAGITLGGRGGQCKITSWAPYDDAAPLRDGCNFCCEHANQRNLGECVRCAGFTCAGVRCRTTNWLDHAGAQPLREGELYCAQHAKQHVEQPAPASTTAGGHVPDGTVCTSCGATHRVRKDPSDGTWFCQRCWNEWERDDPLAAVWSAMFM